MQLPAFILVSTKINKSLVAMFLALVALKSIRQINMAVGMIRRLLMPNS